MTGPMFILAGLCVLIGVAPLLFAPMLQSAASTWVAADAGIAASMAGLKLAALAPLAIVSVIAAILLLLIGVGTLVLMRHVRTSPTTETWGCGYAAPSARMQYTSSSFAQWLVDLFGWALRPKVHLPQIDTLFPKDAAFESHVDDSVLERVVRPTTQFVRWLFGLSRYLQQGSLQAYLLYILVIVIGLMLWTQGA